MPNAGDSVLQRAQETGSLSAVDVEIYPLAHAEGLPLPFYATSQSAGLDLCAAIDGDITLEVGERQLIPSGFTFAFPDGHEGQIRPRSGLSLKHGITVLNTPGTVDSDYRGEVKVILVNLGQEPFTITRGMRIAQFVIAPFTRAKLQQVSQPPKSHPNSSRTAAGFGSTGLQATQAS